VDALAETGAKPPAPRLRLSRLRFSGTHPDGKALRFDRVLPAGVTVWRAPNFSGKSTALRAIRWALTGGGWAEQTRTWITEVELDFALEGQPHRVAFTMPASRRPTGAIETIEGAATRTIAKFSSADEHVRATHDYFVGRFALDRLTWMQHAPQKSELVEGGATWATYFRALFLDEESYSRLISRPGEAGGTDQKVFAELLGLPDVVRVNRVTTAIEALAEERRRSTLVRAGYGGSDTALSGERNRLERELAEVTATLEIAAKPGVLDAALAELRSAQDSVGVATSEVSTAASAVQQLSQTLLATQAAQRMLQESYEFRQFFNGVDVVQCPRCEQEITSARVESEQAHGQCRVCARPLPSIEDDALDEIRGQLDEMNQRIALVREDLDEAKGAEARATARVGRAREKHNDSAERVQELTALPDTILAQRDSLNLRLGAVRARLEALSVASEEQLAQRERILTCALSALRAEQRLIGDSLMIEYADSVTELGHTLGLPPNSTVRYTSEGPFTLVEPGREDRSFWKLSPGEQLRLKLAAFIALARLPRVRTEPRHPGVLLLDAPGQHEMQQEDAAGLARSLRAIGTRFGDELQILVVTQLEQLLEAAAPAQRVHDQGKLF